MKRFVLMAMILVLTITGSYQNLQAETISDYPTRVINVVYDDSGSMISEGERHYQRWCQAKYSMEVFASMLSERDTMNIYVMSDYQEGMTNPPELVLSGSDGAAINVEKVHEMITYASHTPFNSVIKAYSDLQATSADEKWLVVLTDGEFQYDPNQKISSADDFFAKKSDDIKVMYLAMGSDATTIKENASKDIYFEKSSTGNEILTKITEISTRIFNSNKITVDPAKCNFSIDVPMSELIVFAQGAEVKINGIKTSDGTLIKASKAAVPVKYSTVATTNPEYEVHEPDKELVGSVLTFGQDFKAGDYTVDVTGAKTVEVYYKPDVALKVYFTDEHGDTYTEPEYLEQGDYKISFALVERGTDKNVENSKLLGEVTYSAEVTNNGVKDPKTYVEGDTITIEEGTVEVEAEGNYLQYNKVTSDLEYSVFRTKNIDIEVIEDNIFTIKAHEFEDKNKPIVFKGTIEGEEFTAEQWELVDDITVKQEKNADKRVDFVAEKTSTPGVVNVYPVAAVDKVRGEKIKDIDIKFTMRGGTEVEKWSGRITHTVGIEDDRPLCVVDPFLFWLLVVLLIIFIIVFGYVIKKRLPRDISNTPDIKIVSLQGYGTTEDQGRYVIKRRYVPYLAEKGYIRVLPTDCPNHTLVVKAARRGKMILLNKRAFAGNRNYKICGNHIENDVRGKYYIDTPLHVEYKTDNTSYRCRG